MSIDGMRTCPNCDKIFHVPPSRDKYVHVYCCKTCYTTHARGPKSFHFKRGYSIGKKGHIYLHGIPGHTSGVSPAHVEIMEKALGRNLTTHEVVHHKNGNPTDNRLENLEVMTKGDHTRLHKAKPKRSFVCPTCSKMFERAEWQTRNRTTAYCSHPCYSRRNQATVQPLLQ